MYDFRRFYTFSMIFVGKALFPTFQPIFDRKRRIYPTKLFIFLLFCRKKYVLLQRFYIFHHLCLFK